MAMRRYDSTCNVCSAHDFQLFAHRSDGVPVIVCASCGHGVVESFTEDVDALYGDDYFGSQDPTIGYSDYSVTSEQGMVWVSALLPLIRPRGRILEIGCANGRGLRILSSAYERFGVEINVHMAQQAERDGVQIVAHNLLDNHLKKAYAGWFDVALAIAVFEHIPDFKGAVEAALNLLQPDGILIFEIPLIRTKDDVWFRSSLEHLHYPTERSIQYLFNTILGLDLYGSAVEAQDWGSIYVGMTSKSRNLSQECGARFETLIAAPVQSLSPGEARFRCLFDLIHAAKTGAETLSTLPFLAQQDLTPLTLRRIAELWTAREKRLAEIEPYLREVERARDWHAAESEKRNQVVIELENYLREVESARDWNAAELEKRDQIVTKLQNYLREVERARDWNAAELEKRDQIVTELQNYLREVERARDWNAAELEKRDQIVTNQQP
jgi:SAM-dependent methyltransferase